MSEMRLNEVVMAGRISQGPVKTEDGRVHFMFEAARESEPFHCVCEDRTAENLLTHCLQGDEISIEGELRWMVFPNSGKTLVIYARYTSYGRKLKTLR
jgi:hypothetical protein